MPNDPMPEERDAEAPGDPAMSRFRERVAALIALVIIIASLVMLALAFHSLDDKEKFARAKDLLLSSILSWGWSSGTTSIGSARKVAPRTPRVLREPPLPTRDGPWNRATRRSASRMLREPMRRRRGHTWRT